jgi:uncharacterized protein
MGGFSTGTKVYVGEAYITAYILREVLVKILHHLSFLLTVLGAINWGLVGLFKFNLVERLFGTMPVVAQAIYIAIGIAGVLFALQEVSEHRILQ